MLASNWLDDLWNWRQVRFGERARQARSNQQLLSRAGRRALYRTDRFTRHAWRRRVLGGFMAAKGLDIEATFKNAFGVEHWIPVADFDFVRFVWSLPPALFSDGQGGKRLVREVMRNQLPARVMDQRHRGIQSPDSFQWYCEILHEIRQFYQDNKPPDSLWRHDEVIDFIERPLVEQEQQQGMVTSILSCYNLDRLRVDLDLASPVVAPDRRAQPYPIDQ
jgi:hypothetical protein